MLVQDYIYQIESSIKPDVNLTPEHKELIKTIAYLYQVMPGTAATIEYCVLAILNGTTTGG